MTFEQQMSDFVQEAIEGLVEAVGLDPVIAKGEPDEFFKLLDEADFELVKDSSHFPVLTIILIKKKVDIIQNFLFCATIAIDFEAGSAKVEISENVNRPAFNFGSRPL